MTQNYTTAALIAYLAAERMQQTGVLARLVEREVQGPDGTLAHWQAALRQRPALDAGTAAAHARVDAIRRVASRLGVEILDERAGLVVLPAVGGSGFEALERKFDDLRATVRMGRCHRSPV